MYRALDLESPTWNFGKQPSILQMTDLVVCIVCGVAIDHFFSFFGSAPIISQKKRWERHKRDPGFLFLSAEELEKHYFQKGCCHWQGLYRLS
jgi:hypothetical protein